MLKAAKDTIYKREEKTMERKNHGPARRCKAAFAQRT